MFNSQDVAEYYNTTQNHYERWWNLKTQLSLHYGIWTPKTRNFAEALVNTNALLFEAAALKSTDQVLDAGCGVGGAALFVHQQCGAPVTGISLSEKQIATATAAAQERGVAKQVNFQIQDFTHTSFPDASFDVIWACESVCHAANKRDFVKESFRLLKKGGRLVLFDFFKTRDDQKDSSNWIKKWADTWAVPDFDTVETFKNHFNELGFEKVEHTDYTPHIQKSAKRMYYAALLGALPSETYNLLHPKVSRFAKTHYRCGYYQYKALKQNLWRYHLVKAIK